MGEFFISDNHFCHEKIIGFSNRPFKTTLEMNEEMIRRWNEKVTSHQDIVYINGDFAMTKDPAEVVRILKKLNGRKALISGNHDKLYLRGDEVKRQFEFIKSYHLHKTNGTNLIIFHYPMIEWEMMRLGSIHLYGHVHDNPIDYVGDAKNMLNISADANNLCPLSLDEVFQKVAAKNKAIDERKKPKEK